MECQTCSGELILLGTLGTKAHYRCRSCGLDSSGPAEAIQADSSDEDDAYPSMDSLEDRMPEPPEEPPYSEEETNDIRN